MALDFKLKIVIWSQMCKNSEKSLKQTKSRIRC